ncbi:hypothetical protein KPC83_03520 [Collinsella sp. zg1085]|uniref:putative ABC transporter permease subunit n=1 Tax=Collinsella sp. zg1085 TaxID=2844380 RepID=UPI001C0E52AE|nr:hypothetical protein [Collinsella sp. zg1085]QWT18206.1 hypothetical protein KPC83_03520 [Collinsella sp. zg1085]
MSNESALLQPSRFDFKQFWLLLWVIRKGELNDDALGMGLASGARSKKRKFAMPALVRTLLMSIAFLTLAIFFFFMGTSLASLSPFKLLQLAIMAELMMTLLTGVYSAVNLLFFSKDNGYYLTLPVSPIALMWAKIVRYLALSIFGSLLLLPLSFGGLYGQGAAIGDWVLVSVAYLASSLVISIMITLFTIVIVRFSSFAHDKDKFAQVFGIIIMVLAIGAGVGIQFLAQDETGTNVMAVADTLLSGPVLTFATIFCTPLLGMPYLFDGTLTGVLIGLVIAYGSAVLWCLAISWAGKAWYLDGMMSFQGSGARRSKKQFDTGELSAVAGSRSTLKAFIARDWKHMTRTPAFFNQMVLSPLLSPIYIIAIFGVVFFVRSGELDMDIATLYTALTQFTSTVDFGHPALVLITLGLLAFKIFMGLSSMAYTLSVSRDGEDFFFLRTLPVNWRTYLMSKLVTGMHGDALVLIILITIIAVAQLPLVSSAYLIAVLIVATLSLAFLSTAQGALFPVLHWESEAQVMKGGAAALRVYASLIVSALAMSLPALLLGFTVFGDLELPLDLVLWGALGLQVIICVVCAWLLFGFAARSLAARES